MSGNTATILVLIAGWLLLGVGLACWLGWPVAMTIVGALLVAAGVTSAAGAGRNTR
jgi:hypothetical protein